MILIEKMGRDFGIRGKNKRLKSKFVKGNKCSPGTDKGAISSKGQDVIRPSFDEMELMKTDELVQSVMRENGAPSKTMLLRPADSRKKHSQTSDNRVPEFE